MDNSSNIDYIDPYWIYKHLKVADNDIKIFKKFISVTSSNEFHLHETRPLNWEPVFSHMLELMSNTEKMGQEKSLLASQAFFTLLITQYESYFVTDFLLNVIKEMSDIIFLIGKQYQIADGELFKLIVMHGYLKVNHNKDDVNIIYESMFEIIYRNCIMYTKYSYFAYKILGMWLEATMTTDIWSTNNFNLEEKLEAIVFSNWSNAINDISKQNALSIFNLYLKIMQKEYNGFLKYIFEHCLNSISWQDEIKYTILAEICKISHDAASVMTLRYYLLCLSTCLTKTYLRSSGTKVYMAILKGLTEDDWKEKFGPVIQHLINQWESGPKFDCSALQSLCKFWLEPAFIRDMLSSFEMEVLSNNAMEYCNSFKFYEIESGSELLQILANWNENPKLLGELLLEIAKSQLSEIKSDILKAIIEKKPLFGILNAILKVAYQGNSQICQKDVVFSEKIMCILEEITNFYLSVLSSRAESNGYASSFAEMGMAIEESIRNSQIDDDNKSELSLSPSHQLLVSCIWMTFKISCELAAEIGILMHSDSLVNRTMNLISKVLLKCRHKGAVEAAGVAINHLSRHLHNNENYAELPKIYVEKLLENETTSTLNLTRRGAGLTIMFHKIIISDNRRDRPLLHSTVNVLLQLLNENFEISTKHINCNFDMPCARQLHFLHSLVADKEIHAHLVSYMESISLTCFKFMSSEVWVIRNASLQLYGALVPRLVGQNVGGRSLDYGNGYPINHFVTHYPRLARHVMTELNKFSSLPGNDSAFLLEYSSIVHILILLSKMSCGGCDLIDYSSEEYILDIKKNLLKLFGNSIVYIRHFAAKAYASFTPLSSVQFEINALDSSLNDKSSNNLLHGKLLAIHYLCKRFLNGIESMNPRQIKNIRAEVRQCKILSKCQSILQAWSKIDYMHKENEPFCYTLETILLEMSEFKFSSNEALLLDRSMLFIDQLVRTERMKPGFSTFFESLIRLYANYIKEKPNTVNANTLNAILNSKYISESITLLDNLTGFSPLVEFISKYLLLRIHDSKDTLINIMIMHFVNLLRKSSSSSYKLDESISMLMDKVENCESINFQLSHFRNILAIVSCKNQETLNKTLSHVLDSTISKEERTRILAVECLEFAAKHYLKLNSEQKLYVLYSSLFLLKDENVEIRESISNILQINLLPKLCNDTVSSQHSEVLYESLLNNLFQSLSFETNSSVVMFHANIIERFTMICPLKDNLIIKSPFDHEDDDCYKEESKLFNHLYYMIGEGATKTNLNNKDKIQLNLFNTFQVHKCGIEEGFYIEFDNLQDCLTFKSTDYLLKKKNIILNKIRYRNQIIHLNIEK